MAVPGKGYVCLGRKRKNVFGQQIYLKPFLHIYNCLWWLKANLEYHYLNCIDLSGSFMIRKMC